MMLRRRVADAAATVGFAANAYKQNQIFPPPISMDSSGGNKNSSELAGSGGLYPYSLHPYFPDHQKL